jgi:hypothetical protein
MDYSSQISEAKKSGYSNDQIIAHLAGVDPQVKEAIDSGYKPDDIISHLSSISKPVSDLSKGESSAGPASVSTPPVEVSPVTITAHREPALRQLAKMVGMFGGGMIGTGAGIETGPGALVTGAFGAGLGGGLAGQVYDFLAHAFSKSKDNAPAWKSAIADTAEGATAETGGQILGAGLKAAAPYVAKTLAKLPTSFSSAKDMAEALIQRARQAAHNQSYASGTEATTQQAASEAADAAAARLAQTPEARIATVGQVRETPAEIGGPVQQTAVNEKRNLEAAARQTDAVRRASRAVAADAVANGGGITTTPAYKDVVSKLTSWKIDPSGKAPTPEIQNLYQKIIDRISPQLVNLDAKEAQEAAKNGVKLIFKDGKAYRSTQPDLDTIDETRRWLGTVFSGKSPENFGAIAAQEQKNAYGLLDNLQENLVGQSHPRLQENWRNLKQGLQDFETKIGKNLVGIQPGTEVPLKTPEAVTQLAFGGAKGAGDYDQLVAALKGNERVARKAVSDFVATGLNGKTYDQAKTALDTMRPMLKNQKLASLLQRSEDYLASLKAKEAAGTAGINATKEASTAADLASKASAKEAEHLNFLSDINNESDPKKAANMAMGYFSKLSKIPSEQGGITPQQYDEIVKQYKGIDFSKPEAARATVKNITNIAGKAIKWTTIGAGTAYGAREGIKALSPMLNNGQ